MPERSWTSVDPEGNGAGDIFISHAFSGDADWSDTGVYLSTPDNAEMTVSF